MAEWRVEYQGADKKPKTTYVTLPDDKYKTARDVQNAIERGEVADLSVKAGAIVLVQKHEGGFGVA